MHFIREWDSKRLLDNLRWAGERDLSEHAFESQQAIERVLQQQKEGDKVHAARALSLAIMAGDPIGDAFGQAEFLSEAHAIAGAQALHSIADILSAAVNLFLFNQKRQATSSINFGPGSRCIAGTQ